MKIVNCQQGTPEWFLARMGVPSASDFAKIITPAKGELSKSATGYIATLIGELLTKEAYPDGPPWGFETFQNKAMAWGSECEAEARAWYSLERDLDIHQIGFCTTDDGRFGCSPDGLLKSAALDIAGTWPEYDGCLELKCPQPATMVEWLLDGGLPVDHKVQCHGELLVTGAKWLDFVAYCPAVPRKLIVRIEPDEFTKKLAKALDNFHEMFLAALDTIRNGGQP